MDNQRNKLHKFLKISQKHNKKYIYIRIYPFRAQFRRWTRRSDSYDSRFGRDPCPVPNERPIRKHSLVLSTRDPTEPSSHKREHIRLCVHYTPIMRNAASGSRDAGRRSGTKEEGCPANFRLSQTPGCSRPRHPGCGSKGPIFSHYFNNRG